MTRPSVKISAVICTRNRSGYLRKSLRSLMEQDISRDEYEIVVVDNGSSDDTRSVCDAMGSGTANFRYVYEGVPGLSRARNVGLEHARGELVAYLDDDGIAVTGWLRAFMAAFDSNPGNVACAVGRIDLLWESPRPEWLSDFVAGPLGAIDYGPQLHRCSAGEFVRGGNLAIRRDVVKELGGFSTSFGFSGRKMVAGEEIVLQQQLEQRDMLVLYSPDALMHHHANTSERSQAWFRRRWFWQGYTEILMDNVLHGQWGRFEAIRHLRTSLNRLFAQTPRGTSPAQRFERSCRRRYWGGMLWACARILLAVRPD